MTHNRNLRAWLYAFLAFSALAGEIWLAVEKMKIDGTQSWALFCIIPVIAVAAAVLIHVAVEDFLSFSWRFFRAPFAASLAVIGLSVALPASISSSGSARDAAVSQVEAANSTTDDAKAEAGRLKGKLVWAEQDRDATCKKSGKDSRKCVAANDTVRSYTERRKSLLDGIKEAPVKAAMPGEKRISWAFSLAGIDVAQDDILNATSMLPSIALAFMGPFFGAMFLSEMKRNKVPVAVPTKTRSTGTTALVPSSPDDGGPRTRRKKETTQDAISFSRAYTQRNGYPPSFSQLRTEFPSLPKASASRVLRKYVA